MDVVATMSDRSIPLTVVEFEEWGNPQNEEFYNYMLRWAHRSLRFSIPAPYPTLTHPLHCSLFVQLLAGEQRQGAGRPFPSILLQDSFGLQFSSCVVLAGLSGHAGHFGPARQPRRLLVRVLAAVCCRDARSQRCGVCCLTSCLVGPHAHREPMKWVARLREVKTDNNPLLFKCKTAAGHGGSSGAFSDSIRARAQFGSLLRLFRCAGRYKALEEKAMEFGFILDQLGIHA